MLANLLLSAGSACAALAFWTHAGITRPVACALGLLSLWQFRCAMARRVRAPVILRLGGFSWDMFSFCRGWLITGQVGTGKTVAAINTMLWQVSKNCPTWGGVGVDDKGLYWETLTPMLGNLCRASHPTHEVELQGMRLASLLPEIAGFRLGSLRSLPAKYEPQGNASEPFIERLSVRSIGPRPSEGIAASGGKKPVSSNDSFR